MRLSPDKLPAQLRKNLAPLYLVFGEETLLAQEAADAIRAAARQQGYGERECLSVETSFDWHTLRQLAASPSLFAERRLLELRLGEAKPGDAGSKALCAYAARLAEDAVLLITAGKLDWQTQKSRWFNALDSAGVVVAAMPVEVRQLPHWIERRLRDRGLNPAPDAVTVLSERVEGNLLAAHQEIQKLGLLYPAGALSLAQIREAVLNVARYDIDGLREALLAGDVARLSRTLDGLMHEGEAPPLVLWAMSEEIRALAILRSGLDRGRPLEQLLKEAKVWGPRQNPVKKALQRLSTATLEAALQHAGKIDRLAKGVGQGNIWEEFLRLGLSLSAQK